MIPIVSDFSEHGLGFSDFLFGDMMILVAGFFYCLDTFIAKHISPSISIRRIIQVMSMTGAVLAFSLMIIFQIPFYFDLLQMSFMSIVGVLGIGITAMFFYYCIKIDWCNTNCHDLFC